MSKKSKGKRKRQSMLDLWQRQYQLFIYGKIPVPLYKAFSKKEYAEEFCSGKIRFQTLEYYKDIENSERIDRSEGISEITTLGESLIVDPRNRTMTSVPGIEKVYAPTFEKAHFIYCLSLPKNGGPDPELEKFGSYFVKLNCPSIFLTDLAIAMQSDDKLSVNPPCMEATRVVYDKFEHYIAKPRISKLNRMRWAQKPRDYAQEREYRIHFQACTVEPISEDSAYYIQLQEPVKYCEIIEK